MNFFYLIVKRLNIIILVIGVFVFGMTMKFLYSNMYQTIIQAEQVVLLSRQVSGASFNEKLWEQVTKDLEAKKSAASTPPSVNDPFNF